jgi:hypothetical protein
LEINTEISIYTYKLSRIFKNEVVLTNVINFTLNNLQKLSISGD